MISDRWVPITEALPDGPEWLQVAIPGHLTVQRAHYHRESGRWINDLGFRVLVTHWRAQPQLPPEEERTAVLERIARKKRKTRAC